MTRTTHQAKIEYGDFQTPLELAYQVCRKLKELGVAPEIVIEPTCGVGAFIEASAYTFPDAKIVGVEINNAYLDELKSKKHLFINCARIHAEYGDFFAFDWAALLKEVNNSVLVIGNFPWVTNSQQGAIGGSNLPEKINFQNHSGLDAITGKSNFDISEWMLIQTAQWMQNRTGYLGILCKTSVARKFLNYLHSKHISLSRSSLYNIDAKKHFGASVGACLLFCEFKPNAHHYDYRVYEHLDSPNHYTVGHRNGIAVRDLDAFERLKDYYGSSKYKWRSGVKHDCAEIMELNRIHEAYINGLGEILDIEADYVFPLLKGSDIGNNRVTTTNRYMLVTQKAVGETTEPIKRNAPKTWAYLETHAEYLARRKSRIYQDSPRFSMFGVGPYTFAPYKIAICGLYKNLEFRLIGQLHGKPVVFDDTVYFLGFDRQEEAEEVFEILSSPIAKEFYSSLIFWDDKRPIKTSVLNSLNLELFGNSQPLRLF